MQSLLIRINVHIHTMAVTSRSIKVVSFGPIFNRTGDPPVFDRPRRQALAFRQPIFQLSLSPIQNRYAEKRYNIRKKPFKVVLAIVNFLHYLADAITPPPIRVFRQATSFIPNAWLCLTAQLGIPDLLKSGPMSSTQIAEALEGVREDDIFRGMRLLVNNGFYSAVGQRTGQPVLFRNNSASATLRIDHPNSIRHLVITWHRHNYRAFSQDAMLWHLQQKGGDETPCAFQHATGQTLWDYLESRPAEEKLFATAMQEGDIGLKPVVKDFDWAHFKRVLDIGGANGTVVAALLKQYPNMEGVVFDQPQVINGAAEVWKDKPEWAALRGRVKLVGGDFFKPETIPAARDGDVYVLRTVIHDWSDEASIRILRAVRQSIGKADARLALIELCLIPEFGGAFIDQGKSIFDMLMHAVVGGKERTEAQWEALFAASGFQLVKVHPTRGTTMVVEAKPF